MLPCVGEAAEVPWDYQNIKLRPTELPMRPDDWRQIDWSLKNKEIAAEIKRSVSRVSQARCQYAWETSRPAKLERMTPEEREAMRIRSSNRPSWSDVFR